MESNGIHFEEIVRNWNTGLDDVNAEFDDVIRSERGPGKFYENMSPDDNPEAFLDILATGNFLEPHHRPKSPDVADFGDAQSEAENLQIDDSISECFDSTTKNRRVSRTKEQHNAEKLRKSSKDHSIGGDPSTSPPGDFNKAAKTIIRQCELIQKDYDGNGLKKRSKHKGEYKKFGNNGGNSIQHGDATLELAPPGPGFRTNRGAHVSVVTECSEIDITHAVGNTKSTHKRKIAKIFRKKNDKKGQRGHRAKTPTLVGNYNKGNRKQGPGIENIGHGVKVKGKSGIIDSRVTENSSFGNVLLDNRRDGTNLDVNAHVIEVNVPYERGRTDTIHSPLESQDLNNNRRSGRKDLSKQLGVPDWILQEVCANFNNGNKAKTPPAPNRDSVTSSATVAPVSANFRTSGSAHDRRVEQMKKLTGENSHLTSLLSEGRVITEDMKTCWLRIDENINMVLASRPEASRDTSRKRTSIEHELQILMNSHLEDLLRLSAVLEEAEPAIGINPIWSAKPILPQKGKAVGVSVSTQTTECILHRPPKRRIPLPGRNGIDDNTYTEMSRQNGCDSDDTYETLRIIERPQIVGKVSPFRRVGQDGLDTTERSGRIPGGTGIPEYPQEGQHERQASLPRDTGMLPRGGLGEISTGVGKDLDQHGTGHATESSLQCSSTSLHGTNLALEVPLNRGSGGRVPGNDRASVDKGSTQMSERSSTTDSIYERPPPLPKGRRCVSSYNVDYEPPPLPLGRRERKGKGCKNAVCKTTSNVPPTSRPLSHQGDVCKTSSNVPPVDRRSSLQDDDIKRIVAAVCVNGVPNGLSKHRASSYQGDFRATRVAAPIHSRTSSNVVPVGGPSSLQSDDINKIVAAVCVNGVPNGVSKHRASSYQGDFRATRVAAPIHNRTSSNVPLGGPSSLQTDDINKIVAAVCVNGVPNGRSKNRPSSYQGDDRVTRVRAPFHCRTKSVDGYCSPTIAPSLGSFRRHASDGQIFKTQSNAGKQQENMATASNRALNDSSPEHQYLALLPPSPLTAAPNDLEKTNDLDLVVRKSDPPDPFAIPPRRVKVNSKPASHHQSSIIGQGSYPKAPPVVNETDRFPKSGPSFESFSDKLLIVPKVPDSDVTCCAADRGDHNGLDADVMTFDGSSTCAVGLSAAADICKEKEIAASEGKPRQRLTGMFDLMEKVNSKWKEIEQKYGSEVPPSGKNFSTEVKSNAVENCRALGGAVGHVEAMSAFMKVGTRPGGLGVKELSSQSGRGMKEVSAWPSGVGVKDVSARPVGVVVKEMSFRSEGVGVTEVSSQSGGVGEKEVSTRPVREGENKRKNTGLKLRSTSADCSSDGPRLIDSVGRLHSGRGDVDLDFDLRKENGRQDLVLPVTARSKAVPESSSRRRRSRSRRRQSADIQSSQDSDFADKSEISSDEGTTTSSGAKRSTKGKVSRRKMVDPSSCDSGIKGVAVVARRKFLSTGNDVETSDMSSIEGETARHPRRRFSEDSLARKKSLDRALEKNVRRMSETVIRRPDNPNLAPGVGMIRSKGNFCLNRISGDEGESKSESVGHVSRHRGNSYCSTDGNQTLGLSDRGGNSNELRQQEGDATRNQPPRNSSVLRASYSQIKEIYEGKKGKSPVTSVTAKQCGADGGLQKPEVLEQSHPNGSEMLEGKEQRLVLNKVYDSSDLSSGDENKPWYEHSDDDVLILDGAPRIVNKDNAISGIPNDVSKDNSIYGIPGDMLVTFF